MSNNIYDILKTMRGLSSPKTTLTEGKKAKPDFRDLNKNGNRDEPMKKAAKEKSKGAIAEAVARVEQQLAEKYMGFKKRLGEESDMKKTVIPVGVIDGPGGYEEAQKRIKDYEAGKTNKDGKALPPVEDRSRPADKPKTKAVDESNYNEDMLSPGQKKIAKMSPPPGKIDANDLAALRAGKKKKAEGNAFSGAVAKAKATGQDEFSVDGKEYKVQEGWDEMMADVKQRSGPQPSGGSGIKAGKRYGGSAQKDEPETDNETGEVAKKGRGRPKKDKFAK